MSREVRVKKSITELGLWVLFNMERFEEERQERYISSLCLD